MLGHDIWLQSQVHEDQNIKMDFEAVTDVRPDPHSYMQQPVLEAWLTLKDPQSGNDHLHIPEVYESLAYARVLRYVFWNSTNKILSTHVRHTTPLIQCNIPTDEGQAPTEAPWEKHW